MKDLYYDLRALLAGYCNHCPWNPDLAGRGGYRHWRCGLFRGHDGMHRGGGSYVWSDDGQTDFMPLRSRSAVQGQPSKWSRTSNPRPWVVCLRRWFW